MYTRFDGRSDFHVSFEGNLYRIYIEQKQSSHDKNKLERSKSQIKYTRRTHDVTLYRFSEWQQNLASEHMTVVSRRGAVDHDPVTVMQLLHFKISTKLLRKNTTGARFRNVIDTDI